MFSINTFSELNDCNGIILTLSEHRMHFSFIHSQGRFPVVREFCSGSNYISEVCFGISEDSSCQSIHSTIVSCNLEISVKHLERFEGSSVFKLDFLVSSEDNIYNHIRFAVSKSFTFVNSRENIKVPNSSTINK